MFPLLVLGVVLLGIVPASAQSGIITGVVRDAATGAPLSTGIGLCVQDGAWCRQFGSTDASGVFRAEVSPGIYFVYTVGVGQGRPYIDEIFPDILCPGACDFQVALRSGTPLVVVPGGAVRADLDLYRGGAISGTVVDAQSAAPLAGVSVWATLVAGGVPVGSDGAVTDASGRYTLEGLPPGRYYAQSNAFPSSGYLNEVYDNVACGRSCAGLDITIGTPIDVALGATVSGRDFALEFGGRIGGTITDAVTSLPLAGVCVSVLRPIATGVTDVADACSDATGAYQVGALPAGSYLLIAEPFTANYVSELFDGVPCPGRGCDLSLGATVPVAMGATTGGRDFALDPGGMLRGVVRDAATGQASISGTVFAYTRDGTAVRPAGKGTVDYSTGEYLVKGLPAGTYYAYTSVAGYRNAIFDDVRCQAQACTEQELASMGTPIAVAAGGTTGGVDFAVANDLVPGAPLGLTAFVNGTIATLSWGEPDSGGRAASYVLEAGASPGDTFVQAATGATQFVVGGVPPGRYFARVRAINANGTGPASQDVLVVVPSAASAPIAPPVQLAGWIAGPRLTLTWGAPAAGPAVTGYLVEAGSATGVTDIACVGVHARALSFMPVPPGYYFLRVRAMNAHGVGPASSEVLVNAGEVPAPPLPPRDLVSRVEGSSVTLAWSPPFGEPPVSYVVRAGSEPGLSNRTEVTVSAGVRTLAFSGVPAGLYYVRVHAVGALGEGPASPEVLVIVR